MNSLPHPFPTPSSYSAPKQGVRIRNVLPYISCFLADYLIVLRKYSLIGDVPVQMFLMAGVTSFHRRMGVPLQDSGPIYCYLKLQVILFGSVPLAVFIISPLMKGSKGRVFNLSTELKQAVILQKIDGNRGIR